MNKKLLGLILILISLVIALVILYFIFFYQAPQSKDVAQPKGAESLATTTEIVAPKPLPKKTVTQKPASPEELSEENARQLALNFVQSYGSYSNQVDRDRLNDLRLLVTPDYYQTLVNQSQDINENYESYAGYTTRAIIASILVFESDRSVIMVSTKRTEQKAETTAREFDQDIKVELLKSAKSWKVSGATWQ